MTKHRPVVQVKEYHVNAYPRPVSPNAGDFLIRVIRWPDSESWSVFRRGGFEGAWLDTDGNWSFPPKDGDPGYAWRKARRYTKAQALALAKGAAPYMTSNGTTIDEMLAWEDQHATVGK